MTDVAAETYSVVLCDDQPDFVRLLSMLLGMQPELAVVGTAGDGHEAIAACDLHRPDLILLDISMPNLDGIAAIPGIREASPDTRIVMLSGFSATQIKQRALDAGADAFIEKGAPMPDIPRIVLEHCRAREETT